MIEKSTYHQFNIRLNLNNESKETNKENQEKIDDLIKFLEGVKTTTFFGLFKEQARIRAKSDGILEARTGNIFQLIYYRLTASSKEAIAEREKAKNIIENMLVNFSAKYPELDITQNIENIKTKILNPHNEFSRTELLVSLKDIKDKIPKSIAKSQSVIESNPVEHDLQQEPKVISNILQSDHSFENEINSVNDIQISTHQYRENESENIFQETEKKYVENIDIITKTNNSNLSIYFKNKDDLYFSSAKKIMQIEADLYIRPRDNGFILFNDPEITKIESKFDYLKLISCTRVRNSISCNYTQVLIEKLINEDSNDRNQNFIENLIKQYLQAFNFLFDSSNKKDIALEPITAKQQIASPDEIEALCKAIVIFKKQYSGARFAILCSSGMINNIKNKLSKIELSENF